MLARTRTSTPAALTAGVLLLVLAIFAAPCAGVAAPDVAGAAAAHLTSALPPEPISVAPAVRLAYVTGTARSSPAVWVARGDGSERKRLGPGGEPLLAPSGQSVAVSLLATPANAEQGPALAVYSAVGAAPAYYLNLATVAAVPLAWSPDSRYLAVAMQSTSVTSPTQGSGLAVLDTSTGTLSTIAHGTVYGASFAGDGSDMVAYALAPSELFSAAVNVYVSQPDGASRRPLTSDGRSLYPVWGAQYIAFDRERTRKGYAPAYQIWLTSPSGGAARRLTNVHAGLLVDGLVPLAFSADGSRLLAEFEGQDTSNAWTVTVSSGRARMLRVHRRSVQGAGISADGRTLLIDEDAFEQAPSSGRVATIPFTGGPSKVLIGHGAQASWNG